MKKFTIFLLSQLVLLLIFGMVAKAQTPEQSQLYVVSGGAFSDPNDFVEISNYDPQTTANEFMGTIYSQAVQDAVIHMDILYVTATDSLVAYDVVSKSRIAATAVAGANLLHIVGNDLYMSVQYPETSGFLKVFDKNTLELKATVDGISGETAGMVTLNDKLFVAVPGAYGNSTGSIAVVDPISYQLLDEIDLGAGGVGVYNLYVYDGQVLTVNKSPWGETTGYLSLLDPETLSFTNYSFQHTIGKGIEVLGDFLYLILNNGVGIIDLDDMVVAVNFLIEDPGSANFIAFGDVVFDSVHNYFYATTTDYASFGTGAVYDISGDYISSFPAGISAEALAVNYTTFTSLTQENEPEFAVYPNPAMDFIRIKTISGAKLKEIKISSMQGKMVAYQKFKNEMTLLDISGLSAGIYFVEVQFDDGSYAVRKILKK